MDLWGGLKKGSPEVKVRPPPEVNVTSITIHIDYSDSQIPFSGPSLYPDPEYPMDSYVRRAGGGSKGGSLPAGRAEIPIFPASEGESHSLGLPAPMDSSLAQSASHEAPYIFLYFFLTPNPFSVYSPHPKVNSYQ